MIVKCCGLINKFPKNTRQFYNSFSMELWPEGVFSKVMRPTSNPRHLLTRNICMPTCLEGFLKKSRKPKDHLIIMPYRYYHVHTDCPILSVNSWTIKHVFTVLLCPNPVHEISLVRDWKRKLKLITLRVKGLQFIWTILSKNFYVIQVKKIFICTN